MRKELVDILACPISKGKLILSVEEQNGEEIMRGTLYSPDSGHTYRIDDGIANLLPPDLQADLGAKEGGE